MFFWKGFENVFLGNVFENVFWEGLENFFLGMAFFLVNKILQLVLTPELAEVTGYLGTRISELLL